MRPPWLGIKYHAPRALAQIRQSWRPARVPVFTILMIASRHFNSFCTIDGLTGDAGQE